MKFRKKPVVIEATQFDGVNLPEGVAREPETTNGYIDTLEGRMTVSLGDWVITGVKGELYSRKPDIFEATYEPVEPLPKPCTEIKKSKSGISGSMIGGGLRPLLPKGEGK
jgi:hypothetical protein